MNAGTDREIIKSEVEYAIKNIKYGRAPYLVAVFHQKGFLVCSSIRTVVLSLVTLFRVDKEDLNCSTVVSQFSSKLNSTFDHDKKILILKYG